MFLEDWPRILNHRNQAGSEVEGAGHGSMAE